MPENSSSLSLVGRWIKRKLQSSRDFVYWGASEFPANPAFAVYSRRLNGQNKSFYRYLINLGDNEKRDLFSFADRPDLPKIVWMYWHQGEENAPFVVRRCIESWRRKNPGWDIRVLSAESVSSFVDLSDVPHTLPTALVSDVLRLRLLRDYGGVWSDATIYCHRPLDEWLWTHMTGGFFLFKCNEPSREIENWFIAGTPGHVLTRLWARDQIKHFKRFPNRRHPYFISFYVFQWRVRRDPEAKRAFAHVPSLHAAPSLIMIRVLEGVLHRDKIVDLVAHGLPLSKLNWRLDIMDADFDALCACLDRSGPKAIPSEQALSAS